MNHADPKTAGDPATRIAMWSGPRTVSTARARTEPTLADLGLAQQAEIFETFGGPVVDSRDLLADPQGILRALCQALGVPFDGRRPGTTRCLSSMWPRRRS